MWLTIGIAVVFTIGVLIIYKLERNNTRWNRKAALLQTIGVIWALLFAVYSIESANEGTNNTIGEINRLFQTSKKLSEQFERLSFNLSSMPNQLEGFSKKIIKLDSTIDKQQINISLNLKNFRNSISDLNKSLSIYRNSINDYSSQLSKIVSATDSQLVIWKDQQAIVKKEYSRRSILDIKPTKCIHTDSTFTIDGVTITNTGDIEANLIAIVLIVNGKDVISINDKIIRKTRTEKNNNIYQIDFGNLYPKHISQHDRITLSEFKITLRVNEVLKETFGLPNIISYKISYQSQYSSEPFSGLLYCK